MNKKLVIFIALLSTSICSFANVQVSLNKTIIEIHSYASGASFKYSPASSNGLGCSGTGAADTVHIDWGSDDNYKAMYSLALAAYTANKTVGFGVNGCTGGNGGDIPKVYRVDVKD